MRPHRVIALLILVLLATPSFAARRHPGGNYVVKAGDTGGEICAKYGLTLTEFAALNPTLDVESLKAGERVSVSGKIDATSGRKTKPAGRKSAITPEVSVQPDARQSDTATVDEKPAKRIKTAPPQDTAADVAEPLAPVKPHVKPAIKPKSKYLAGYYDEPSKKTKASEPSVAASLMRVVGALVFVVALAVLSLYALKHFSTSKALRKTPQRSIRVIETTGLGPNRALHIVQAGNKFLLVGSTPNQINLVAELSSSDAEEADPERIADFASILDRSSSDQDRADTASKLSDAIRDGASFLQKKTTATRSMRAKAESDES